MDQRFLDVLRWAILVLFPVGLVWLGTCWIRRRSARIGLRALIAPTCVIAFAGISSWDEGTWQCLVCGAMEQRVTYVGLVLEKSPPNGVPEDEDCRAFERWYDSEIRTPHPHDWVPVGCHARSSVIRSGVACSEYPRSTYYHALPRLPNPKLAASMIERILRASHEERCALMLQLNSNLAASPFTAIAEGKLMTMEEFDRAHSVWLAEHPDWR